MSLVVQKFGGSSLADTHHIFNVAKKITDAYSHNNDIVVVVSAQGDTTDNLINLIKDINPHPSPREADALLATGEQMSASLMAMAIESLGFPAISLTGWQAGVKTTNHHRNAQINKIVTDRIQTELNKKNIVVIAGFQGLNENNDITTLGRGASDTSAVAIAHALNADMCKIYTDVDGVYTADPRIVSSAKKLSALSYDEMFELSCYGAQVLNERSISTARKYKVEVEVLSSMLDQTKGTFIKNDIPKFNNIISGIAVLNNIVKITLANIKERAIFYDKILPHLNNSGINIDTELTPVGQKQDCNVITFTVFENELNQTLEILKKYIPIPNSSTTFYDKNKSKITVVNLSDNININIASIIFETLAESKINVEMVACTSKRVSVIIPSNNMHAALNSIHNKLFEEDNLL